MQLEQTKDKQVTYKLSYESDFDGTAHEITMKSKYMDGISFDELMNGFRQFILALGYGEETAKYIICVKKEDVELMGYEEDDFQIVKTE